MSTTLERVVETDLPTIIAPELPEAKAPTELPAFFVESTVSYSTLEDYLARGLISQEQIDNARAQVVTYEPKPQPTVSEMAAALEREYLRCFCNCTGDRSSFLWRGR